MLFELFSAPRGKVLLGRVTSGRESGRIVRLRALGENVPAAVGDVVAGARTLTHPEFVKVLGIVFDGEHYYLASEHLPGVALFELIALARARQQGFELAAAVHVTLTALRLVEQASGLLGAAGLARTRLFATDSIWIAEFGETLLAEPGLVAYLDARGAPETGARAVQADTLTAAVELYHLVTGKLLTGDLAAAVAAALPEPLADALTDVFSWSDTEASDTVSSFGRTLARLPAELRGNEAGVARALRQLAGDVLSERERRLAEYRPGLGANIDDPTRMFSAPAQDFGPDEATVVDRRRVQPSALRVGPHPAVDKYLASALAALERKPRAEHEGADFPPAAAAPSTRERQAPPADKRWYTAFAVVVLTLIILLELAFAVRAHPAWFHELATPRP